MAKYVELEALISTIEREIDESPNSSHYLCSDGTIICTDVGYVYEWIGEYAGVLMRSYPAADVAPVMHGEWVKDEHGALYCNICGNGAEERFGEQCETPYCNNCGAVMKNGGEPVDYKTVYPWLRLKGDE